MPDSPFKLLFQNQPDSGKTPLEIVSKWREQKEDAIQWQDALFKSKGFKEKLRGDYRLLRGWSDGNQNTDSNHTVRMVFSMTKSVIAELMGNPPNPKLKGRTEQYREKSVMTNNFIKAQNRKNKSHTAWLLWTFMKILHGTAIMSIQWDYYSYSRKVPKLVMDEDTLEWNQEMFQEDKIVYEGPVFKPVLLENFLWDTNGHDMETCGWCAEQDDRFTGRDIQHFYEAGIFQMDKKTKKAVAELTGGEFFAEERIRDDYYPDLPERQITPTFRLDRYYTDDKMFFILDEKYLLNQDKEFQENPFQIMHCHRKPYICGQFWPMPEEFLGLGVADLAASSQHYASMAMRLELDNMRDAVHRRWKSIPGNFKDPDALYDANNAVIIMNDLNGSQELDPVKSFGAGMRIKDAIRADAQDDMGISDILQGNRIGGAVSATEAAEVATMSKKQLTVVHYTQIVNLTEAFELQCRFNEAFMDPEEIEYEGQMVTIMPEDFSLDAIDVSVDPNSLSVNYELMNQKQMEILAQALERHVQYGYVDILAIDKARVEAIGKKPEDFLHLPGEMQNNAPGNQVAQGLALQNSAPQGGQPAGPGGPPPGGMQPPSPQGNASMNTPGAQLVPNTNLAVGSGMA